MLDPRRLRLLVLLESAGTVRGVAEAAALSPSAVSQQLAVLEREAGVGLLRRHGRRVALTPAGITLAEHARGILDRIGAAEDDVRAAHGGVAGPVAIAGFTSAMQGFVLAATATLRASHPAVRVRLAELGPAECVTAVRRGDADLGVVADLGEGTLPRAVGLHTVPLTADTLHAVLPPGHAAIGDRVPLTALRDEDWLLDGSEYEDHLVRVCRRAGFEPRTVARLVSHEALVRGVALGLGVTILPTLALRDARDVVGVPLAPAAPRALLVLHRPDGLDRRAVALTADALVAAARAAGPRPAPTH